MFRRDRRFVPERNPIGRPAIIRMALTAGAAAMSLAGLSFGVWEAQAALRRPQAEVVWMEPGKNVWKRKPDSPGGRLFPNKGLEINHVQAELFEPVRPEEIVLAPPPEDF